jgi:mutual gliding-motility protein MglA
VSSVNVNGREIAAKIVFYGPGLSGKTTTLKRIYESVKPQHRREMVSLATEGDRTLFFDFLPVKVERVGDYAVRLALYTVPGQVFYNATRKLVLQGADGVVFVADSQSEALDNNRESLVNLEENLLEQGIRLERFPLVLQYNKRDVENALPVEQMRSELNPRNVPDFETCATTGKNVLEALKAITRLVIKDLRTKGIVPAPRGAEAPPQRMPSLNAPTSGMADQIQAQLRTPGEARKKEESAPRAPGPASTLCPAELLEYARAAENAFASGDYVACVRSCDEAVRRSLKFTGEGSLPAQAYFLKLDGQDLLKLQGLLVKSTVQAEEAAFAIYVAMQTFARLNTAGLRASGAL